MIRDLEDGLRRDTLALLLAAHDGTVRVRLLPDLKDDSGKLFHVLELTSRDLDPVVLHVHSETGLIARQTYVASGPGQPLVEEVFSDYRAIDGLQVSFKASVRRQGVAMLERRITRITINTPLDPQLFKRPTS
jgi:hypothetical protein